MSGDRQPIAPVIITSLDQAGWEITAIKERLNEGNGVLSGLRTDFGGLKQIIEDQNKATLREHAAANKADNEKLATELKEKFSELKAAIAQDIGEIRPTKITWSKILGLVAALGLPTVGFVGMLIWQASKYPERAEFQRLLDRFGELELDRARRIAAAPSTFATRPEFDAMVQRLTAIELELAKRKP